MFPFYSNVFLDIFHDAEKQIKLLWEFSRQFTIHLLPHTVSLFSSCFKPQNHENVSFQFGAFISNMLNALNIVLFFAKGNTVWCTLRRKMFLKFLSYHNDSVNIHKLLFILNAKLYLFFFFFFFFGYDPL